jgi:hypothetical protein
MCGLARADRLFQEWGGSSGDAQLRIFNAFSEAPALNVTVASKATATALPFQGLAQYTAISSGTPIFTVGVTGATTTLINTTYTISGGAKYTYIVFGPLTGVGAMLGNDAFNDPGNGFFSLRVANAAAGSGAVDIYLTAPGADITSSAPTLTNISYGVTTAFAPIAIGASFEIRVTTTGTKDVLFDSTPKTFAEHSANDLGLQQGQRQAGQRGAAAARQCGYRRARRQPARAVQGNQ